jgi:hypothetical protein
MRPLLALAPARILVGVAALGIGAVGLGSYTLIGHPVASAHFQMQPTASCLQDKGWDVHAHDQSAAEDGATFPYLNYLEAQQDGQKVEIDFFRSATDAKRTATVNDHPIMSGGAYANGNAEASFEEAPSQAEKSVIDGCLADGKRLAALKTRRLAAERRRARHYLSGGAVQWSPDGTRIARYRVRQVTDPQYGKTDELGIEVTGGGGAPVWIAQGMNASGGAEQIPNFSWSPDGKRIAFIPMDKSDHLQYVDLATPNNVRTLVDASAQGNILGGAVWSPDGNQVLYTDFAGIHRAYVGRPNSDDDHNVLIPGGAWPAWSPDGTKIAYVIADTSWGNTDNGAIGVASSDGSGAHLITQCCGIAVSWDAQGRILFSTSATSVGATVLDGLYTANADGTDIAPVFTDAATRASIEGAWMSLSPDRSELAYETQTSDGTRLYWKLIRLAPGSKAKPIPADGLTVPARPALKSSCASTSAEDHDCTLYLTGDDIPAFIVDHGAAAATAGKECKLVATVDAITMAAGAAISAGETTAAEEFLQHEGADFGVERIANIIGSFLNGSTNGCKIAKQQDETILALHAAGQTEKSVKYRSHIWLKHRLGNVPGLHPNLCRWVVDVDDEQTLDIKYPAPRHGTCA